MCYTRYALQKTKFNLIEKSPQTHIDIDLMANPILVTVSVRVTPANIFKKEIA